MELTKSELKAKGILIKHPGITARKFAEMMWENSPAKNKVYNTGDGATRGKGLWLCGGSYLSKLVIKGFVRKIISGGTPVFSWSLTNNPQNKE